MLQASPYPCAGAAWDLRSEHCHRWQRACRPGRPGWCAPGPARGRACGRDRAGGGGAHRACRHRRGSPGARGQLLPGGSLLALAGFALGGAVAAVGGAALGRASDPVALRAAAEARAIAAERARLHNTLERYPMLLEACLELSSARDPRRARAVAARARAHPGAGRLRDPGLPRHLHAPALLRLLDAAGKPCPREAQAEELFVAAEARSLTDRHHGRMRVYIPLRADRRQVGRWRGGARAGCW